MARRTREEAMETRERLLESALEIMSEKPFSKVSMNEIAEKIGLSKGAVYWHFKSKDELLINLVESVCGAGEEELKANGVGFESWDGLRLYFREEMMRTVQSDRHKMMLMLMQRKLEWPATVREKIYSLVKERAEIQRKMVEDVLKKMRLDGTIRNDVRTGDLAAVITSVFHGLLISQFLGVFPMDIAKQIDFIFDAFREQLRPDRADMRKEKVR
jgi:TetR/AcrR family acrAB operon transcriptional repressor